MQWLVLETVIWNYPLRKVISLIISSLHSMMWQSWKQCYKPQLRNLKLLVMLYFWKHLEEKHAANPPSWRANCRFFCTDKIQGQNCAFLFWCGLTNYKAHYNLSWFRPLFEGNSPACSGLIFKMNTSYNELSRELKKFAKWRGKWSFLCLGVLYLEG
jgi:hypothetical protein